MKKLLLAGLAFLLLIQISCNDIQETKNKSMPTSATAANSAPDNISQTEQSPYELHGIIDPGINNMVAFAMQTPRGWQMQQSFTRVWNGSTPINQVYLKLVSPGEESIVEFLPYTPYFYTDGPMAQSMRQTAASFGASLPHTPGEMAPMQPLDYLRNVLLPQLSQRGLQVQVTGQNILPSSNTAPNATTSTAYVDGMLSNGFRVRIDCVVKLTYTRMNNDTYYNWQAFSSVTQSKQQLDMAYEAVTHGRLSTIFNPAWERQNQQLVNNGNIANSEINRRNAAIQKNYNDYSNKLNQETRDERKRSIDRNNEAFGDAISGQGKFENTETGERVKLSDMYNHVYQDKQGNYYGTATQVDANQFDWTELQRVETRNY